MDVVPEIDMDEILHYAKEKNVGVILWVIWKTLEDQWAESFDQFEAWGVKGIKVDFMQRDDQWMVGYYHRVAKEAADRKMLVDFHGAYKPAGLRRMYPNVITREGVRGQEQVKWSDLQTPTHNVTLPFIRMVAGPMDYTPGAMVNAAERNYKSCGRSP
ncbi:MAG: glycoside hydrolase family 97 catalytic domain-containing protein [Bacteroidales bacterium]